MLTGLFVAARIVSNPVSNVLQKQLTRRSADPLFIIGATHAVLALAMIPLLAGPGRVPAEPAFWGNMGLCAGLAVAGNVLLVHALKVTDLSILGPLNAYKAVLSLGLGFLILGEVPSVLGFTGVLLILAGSVLVVDRGPVRSSAARPTATRAWLEFWRDRGIQLRLVALVFSATEAVFLKKALLLSSPLTTLIWWSILGLPLAGAAMRVMLRGEMGTQVGVLRRHWGGYLGLALTTGVMQGTTLLTFGRMQVGYSLALFQLSTLLSVVLGHHFFREGDFRRRFLGALVMVAGAALIGMLGRAGPG